VLIKLGLTSDFFVAQPFIFDRRLFLFFRNLSGRVLSEVSTFLYTLFYSTNKIVLQFIPAGEAIYILF